jgi:hypothetical protein
MVWSWSLCWLYIAAHGVMTFGNKSISNDAATHAGY